MWGRKTDWVSLITSSFFSILEVFFPLKLRWFIFRYTIFYHHRIQRRLWKRTKQKWRISDGTVAVCCLSKISSLPSNINVTTGFIHSLLYRFVPEKRTVYSWHLLFFLLDQFKFDCFWHQTDVNLLAQYSNAVAKNQVIWSVYIFCTWHMCKVAAWNFHVKEPYARRFMHTLYIIF